MKNKIKVKPGHTVKLLNIAHLVTRPEEPELGELFIHEVKIEDNDRVVIDVLEVISKIQTQFPQHEVQLIGPAQTIIEVMIERKKVPFLMFILVWILLFIGAAMAIMNFHEDVSMGNVQQRISYMITGVNDQSPLWFQVPYSIGIGLGMILFFNHVFKKRFNEEPSPMEMELFNYQQNLDQVVIMDEFHKKEGWSDNE